MIKKSTSKKLNIFKSSPLIASVAIIEVILLICVSTFAWFVFAENNKAHTDFISVEPDSGLEIDFNEANEQDYINIWNYLEEFQFEPVTSLDGRNIFIPTTGTFNSTDTSNIKFREATVNDMNSKYINIDFTLTNNGEEDMDVYLNSRSYFKFNDSANGRALRLAFYQNDGSSGAVSSSLLSKEYEGDTPEDGEGGGSSDDTYYIYFDTKGTGWGTPYIECDYTSNEGDNIAMTRLDSTSTIYYYDLKALLDKHNAKNLSFLKFKNGKGATGNSNITTQFGTVNGCAYSTIAADYLYQCQLDSNGKAIEGKQGDHNGLMVLEPVPYTGTKPGGSTDGSTGTGSGDSSNDENTTQTTVYFNNTLGWKQPYAYIWNGKDNKYANAWPGKPMTHISGDIYYYTFSSYYDYIIFNDGNNQGGAVKTKDIEVKDGHIYMISGTNDNGYGWTEEDYNGTVDGGTYPVISPGVSTGFQRPYAPVTQIENYSGKPSVVIPAFASSIDDYNFGSKMLFSIDQGKTLSLSMIVWLEGTDPDCTEDVYSGKDIDMNLVFATSGTGGEDMYTYKFLDKTKENWIDDKITTDTGVSFNPVMQLYDAKNHKGYQMKLLPDGYTWTVDAPQNLINSDHIIFRRVNPMDEEEVWNYWETSGFGNLADTTTDRVIVAGAEGENTTVYFTAFSDGAPTNAKKDSDAKEEPNAPAYSCGGLWGNHNTQIITLYDGTDSHWIKNSDIKDTTSVVTMNYTYNGQTVEYKASGPDKDMYYFVVPERVYTKNNSTRPAITFKRYYNFNTKYALNSDRNPDVTYHRKWDANKCNGKFFEINASSSGTDHSYWGYDVLYIQAKEIMKTSMDDAFMQVHFYADEGSDFYSYLYKNDNFKGGDSNYGFVAVVPSDKKYTDYRIERCNIKDHDEKYNISPLHEIIQYDSDNVSYPNCVAKNICSIENFYLRVYLECSTSYCGNNNDPECYVWDADGSNGNNGWPGKTMTWTSDTAEGGGSGYKQYYFDVDVSRYDHVIFNNNGNQTGDIAVGAGTSCDVSGKIYQWDSSNQRWRSTVKSGVPANETLFTALYNSPDWP